MRTVSVHFTVNIPDVEDLIKAAPQYARFAREEGRFLFDVVASVESFQQARAVTLLGQAALAGIAQMCIEAVNGQTEVLWTSYTKQAVGTFLRVLMEANGFRKTFKKKAVPHGAFTKGEVYEIVPKRPEDDASAEILGASPSE